MTDLMKAAIRCTQCNKYRKHDEFTAPATADGDPTKPVCDTCRADTAKALDNIPVVAMYADGRKERTTAAKALGMGGDLAKAQQNRRDEWSRAAETIDKAIEAYGPRRQMDNLTKQSAFDALAAFDPIRNFGRMVKSYQRDWAQEDRATKATGLAKAESTRRKAAKLLKKAAKLSRKTALAKGSVDAFDDTLSTLAKSQHERQEALAHYEEFMVDASKRIDSMHAIASAGYQQVQMQESRRMAMEQARIERDRNEWLFKAFATEDPILRSTYLARSEGLDIDDED